MAPTNKAIVVGQDLTGKCEIATFDGVAWSRFPFPDIIGKLWGVYSDTSESIWVCGGTVNGLAASILYHWNGSWVDYSSVLTDAKWLYSIAGSGSDDIYVSGVNTSNTGGVWHYTGSWTPTRVNTGYELGVPNAGGQYPMLAVDDNGKAYTSNWIYVSSNKDNPAWELIHETTNSQSVQIRHVGDNKLVLCNNVGGAFGPVRKFDGAVWSQFYPITTHASVCVGAKTFTHYCYLNLTTQTLYESIDGVTVPAGTVNYFSSANRFIYEGDDLWTCGTTFANGTWDTVAQLSYREGGTLWSGNSDYGVGSLDAAAWYDIVFFGPIPPVVSTDLVVEPFIIAKNVIRFDLNKDLVGGLSTADPTSYQVQCLSGGSAQVSEVLPLYGRSVTQIFLKIDGLEYGKRYKLLVDSGILYTIAGISVDSFTVEWDMHRSKVDFTLQSISAMYNTSVGSRLRSILEAIMVSDEEIGGDF